MEVMSQAAEMVDRSHQFMAKHLRPGAIPTEIDSRLERFLRETGAKSSFKGYRGFPANTTFDVNNGVSGGIPTATPLRAGDIVGAYFNANHKGYHAQKQRTYLVGQSEARVARFVRTVYEALVKAIQAARLGARVSTLSRAIQGTIEEAGYSVVRQYVGHGIGAMAHEEPQIPCFWDSSFKSSDDPVLATGMTLCITVIANEGGPDVRTLEDNWTAVTKDGSLSASASEMVWISSEGPRVLPLSQPSPTVDSYLNTAFCSIVTEQAPYVPYRVGDSFELDLGRNPVLCQVKGIKRGGMGIVYFVATPDGDRALKCPLVSGSDRGFYERFRREAATWLTLPVHENVVEAQRIVTLREAPHLLLEYVPGGSLADRLQAGRSMSLWEALPIAIDVCRGLQHAHRSQLVHRDMKPDNILIDGTGRAKISDFGLVKALGSASEGDFERPEPIEGVTPGRGALLTRAGTGLGTPAYMPPEQWSRAVEVGPSADIYSLGVILYQMVCGRLPFELEEDDGRPPMLAFRVMHLTQLPPDPLRMNPALPVQLGELILKCLSKQPASRPNSASEVLSVLESVQKEL